MIGIRFHGRGGQGAVASAEMLAVCAIDEGKYAQAFPSFGPERRGAPVIAYCRVDDKPILIREPITKPDVVVVLDPTVLRVADVASGLVPDGKIAVNTCTPAKELAKTYGFHDCCLATVDASEIAMRIIGRAITNTAMLGVLLKVKPVARLESLFEQINERFPAVAEKNIKALQTAYDDTKVTKITDSAKGGK
ncbi:MAG: 2-oxoacid:acceptor oxidoreductase family protein [Actinomycetota bacterium]|nr:2-oxoacid:acceptor oxidoreductase family protein [Actinomycetota bacterium]